MKVDPVKIEGPYTFIEGDNKKIWLMGLKLEFADNWENVTIKGFRNGLDKILNCNS